jgi:hypothetical protein
VQNGLVIEDNIVMEDVGGASGGCYGIAVDTGYSSPESFAGTVIRRNQVINVGGLGIGVAACPGCVIEDNVIINQQAGWFTGIAVPDRTRSSDDLPDGGAIIRNNSIYVSSAATSATGIAVTTEGRGYTVVSNAIQYATAGGGSSCFDTKGLSASSFARFDYNLCQATASDTTWESAAGSLASWQSATGFDKHSSVADPRFLSPAAAPLSLAIPSSSPAVNAGDPVWSTNTDTAGQTRDTQPDIGAYEYLP